MCEFLPNVMTRCYRRSLERSKLILAVGAVWLGLAAGARAQTSTFTETFTYTDASALVGQGGWTLIGSAANPVLSVNNGAVALATSGQDAGVALGFSASSGTLYAGFDLKISAAQATGDYFFAFNTAASGTNYTGRFFAKSSGAGYVLGIQLGVSGTPTPTPTYSSTVLSFNTAYRIVIRYNFVTGTLNDTATFYVSPTDATETNNTAALGSPVAWAGTTTENVLAAVSLRQGSAGSAATISAFDNLIVSTSFTTAAKLNTATAPSVSTTTPANSATGVAINVAPTVTFNQAVTVTGSWFTLTGSTSGAHTAVVTGGPTTFTLTPDTAFANSETVTLTVVAAQVTEQATSTLHPTADSTTTFTTIAAGPIAPTITTPPATQSITEGGTVHFSVVASGTAPFTYQWRKGSTALVDGGIVSGATTDSLTLTGVALSDAGNYNVVVTNAATSVTSADAVLTVNSALVAPSITTQPTPQSAPPGGTATFSVVATGTAPLTYQWRKGSTNLTNDTRIAGATSATLTISGMTAADAGDYSVVVSNGVNPAATSTAASLVLGPVVTPTGQISYVGGSYVQDFNTLPSTGTFTLAANGPYALNGAPVSASGLGGWSFAKYDGTGTVALFRVDNGSGTSGSVYSHGTTGSTDRALGALSSGSTVPRFGVALVNSTGVTITEVSLSYTGEQWRRGGGTVNVLAFEYGLGATDLNTGTFTAATALDFTAPVTTGSSLTLDGNAVANRAAVSGKISGLSWAPGQTLVLRWTDVNDTGNDDALAIDDLTISTPITAADVVPAVSFVTPADGTVNIPVNSTIAVTFNEAVKVTGTWFTLTGSTSGTHAATVTGGPTSYTLTPTVAFDQGETVTLTVLADHVTDDATGTHHPGADFTESFITFSSAPLAIHTVQGSGLASAFAGTSVSVQGVVVASFQGAGQVGGYYIEAPDAAQDANAATSEGIYVFDNANAVAAGDLVTVTGTVTEYGTAPATQTEISTVTSFTKVSTGNSLPTAVAVTLPFASSSTAERYEGMLVTLSQTLTVTDNYDYGHFGEMILSLGRLSTPTNVVAPGAAAQAAEATNLLKEIVLDDGLSTTYPDPTPYLSGSDPVTATRRAGSTTSKVAGILDNRFGTYVIEPTEAPTFVDANPRAAAPTVGGNLRIAIGNVLNFFNGDGAGGGYPTSRGATTFAEYQRQRAKIVAGITGIAPDIMGLTEVENDGYGATSAIADLVAGLNAAAPSGTTYSYVDASAVEITTDVIHVAFIYRTETVETVGAPKMLNDAAFNNLARNPLAQTFRGKKTGEKFTVCINHFRAKGSAAAGSGNADSGDGQGTNNALRVQEATALTTWLATDPTGSGDPDFLIIGDLNAYAKEDPITTIEGAGYVNLTEKYEGVGGYSYSFNGEFGHLDHALANSTLTAQVVGAATWHVNSDEPIYYDYNTENKSTAQLAINDGTPYRYSDHDPVVIGLNLVAPKQDQTITFAAPADVTTGAAPITLSATASSGLGVTFTLVSGPATLSGSKLTLTGVAGTVTVRASQAGDATYNAATDVTRSFTVAKQDQTISFAALADRAADAAAATLSATASSGLSVSFSLVSGPATLSGSKLTLTGTAGTVTVRASQAGNDAYNAAPSVDRSFTVTPAKAAPAITKQPADLAVKTGETASFSVTATGYPALSYQWRKNSSAIGGATSATFSLPNVQATDAGSYDVVITNEVGVLSSKLVRLTVTTGDEAPVIVAQPRAQTAVRGGTATFTVIATGVPAPSYQWQKNGTALAGATEASLSLASVQATDAATYSVVVTNSAGSVTSANAALRVIAHSYAGTYFGSIGTIGFFAIHIREDNTGVFLGFLTASNTPFVTTSVVVDDAGHFQFGASSTATGGVASALSVGGGTAHALVTVRDFAFDGTIGEGGELSGSLSGASSAPLSATRAATGQTSGLAGFYSASAAGSSAVSYTIVSPSGQVLVLTQTATGADAGVGTVSAAGQIAVTTVNNQTVSATVSSETSALTAQVTSATGEAVTFAGVGESALAAQRFVNASSRVNSGTGQAVAITGFVITGQDSKPILIRAVGPGLTSLGVANALAKPRLQLMSGSVVVATNAGWSTAANAGEITAAAARAGAFPLVAGSADAAIFATLAPGVYSAVAAGADGGTGVVLLEAYDLSAPAAGQRLVNVSVRTQVGTGENIGIAGFVISGTVPKRVLIRGVGPSLVPQGVSQALSRPQLKLYRDSVVLAQNAGWSTSAEAAQIPVVGAQVGAFTLTSNNDAALLVNLSPGVYSVHLSDVNGVTGVGLIEVYELP